MAFSWTYYTDIPPPPSCSRHFTAEEKAALEAAKAAFEQFQAEVRNEPPACHSWPAPVPGQGLERWHGGRCAICGERPTEVEDHCHETGLVRGYLCRHCNWREGRSPFGTFHQYRLRPPAVIVGETYRYEGGWGDTGEATPYIIAALGPVPGDYPAAALYLAAATELSLQPESSR